MFSGEELLMLSGKSVILDDVCVHSLCEGGARSSVQNVGSGRSGPFVPPLCEF